MLEPRGALHSITLLRRDTYCAHVDDDNDAVRRWCSTSKPGTEPKTATPATAVSTTHYTYEHHDAPSVPIHPALEFEVIVTTATTTTTAGAAVVDDTVDTPRSWDPVALWHAFGAAWDKWRRKQWSSCYDFKDLQLFLALVLLVASGVGTVVSAKLQAIPMYNYPNFLNLFSNLFYIPLCFAYIVPASRRLSRRRHHLPTASSHHNSCVIGCSSATTTTSPVTAASAATERFVSPTPNQWAQLRLWAMVGALDALAVTLQTFGSVYLPGTLLVVLPQAVIPVSLTLTHLLASRDSPMTSASPTNALYRCRSSSSSNGSVCWGSHQRMQWHWLGAMIVLVGVGIVLEPVLSSRHAPNFYCEASDRESFCTVCQVAVTEADCAAAAVQPESLLMMPPVLRVLDTVHRGGPVVSMRTTRSLQDGIQLDSTPAECRWLPFDESSQEKEFLEFVWSIVLVASTVPMALSAIYKQQAIHAVLSSSSSSFSSTLLQQEMSTNAAAVEGPTFPPPSLYASGWIAIFQLLFSLLLSIPAAMLATPTVLPWDVPRNIYNGMLCYAGQSIVETGCHPDSFCTLPHAALWVNVSVLCHALYAVSTILVLSWSESVVPLFFALTVIVPLGHLAFGMPWMPHASRTVIHTADLAGLMVIFAGLILYRFSDSPISATSTGCLRPVVIGPIRDVTHAAPTTTTTTLATGVGVGQYTQLEDRDDESIDTTIRFLSSFHLSSLWSTRNQMSYTLLRGTDTTEPLLRRCGDV